MSASQRNNSTSDQTPEVMDYMEILNKLINLSPIKKWTDIVTKEKSSAKKNWAGIVTKNNGKSSEPFENQIKKTNDVNELFAILKEMIKENAYLTDPTVYQLIKKLNQFEKVDYALAIYNSYINLCTTAQNKVDIGIHNIMIKALGENNKYTLAKNIFESLNEEDYNSYTFTIMIDIAGKNADPTLAMKLYEKAKEKYTAKLFNDRDMLIVCTCAIKLAIDYNNVGLANHIYESHKQILDEITHHFMITLHMENNELDKAKKIYKENLTPPIRITNSGIYEINFHEFNLCSTYVALRDFFEHAQTPFEVNIIHGKGSHSNLKPGEIHQVKQGVDKFIKDMSHMYDFTLIPHDNSGCSKYKITKKLELHELLQNGTFGSKDVCPTFKYKFKSLMQDDPRYSDDNFIDDLIVITQKIYIQNQNIFNVKDKTKFDLQISLLVSEYLNNLSDDFVADVLPGLLKLSDSKINLTEKTILKKPANSPSFFPMNVQATSSLVQQPTPQMNSKAAPFVPQQSTPRFNVNAACFVPHKNT